MPDPTHVILIMTDSQGANIVGCYGRPEMHTPYLDHLAQQGMRFDRAYTASPVCGPDRSALFTGTYPHTNGSWGNDMPLGLNIKTVGQRLSDQGIHTGYIGKWHLDATDYFGSGRCPKGWDPQYWFDMRNYLEGMSPEDRYFSRTAATATEIHTRGVTPEFTFAHQCSERAREFLRAHHTEDFFLVVSYDEPHHPFLCPPPYCDMFAEFDYVVGENASDPLTEKPAHHREWADAVHLPRGQRTLRAPLYFGCNSFVDYEIGRVLEAVDTYAPEALVIYTSDHGEPLLSHGLHTKGPAMYEETVRIPFLVRWPQHTPPGSINPHPISHLDLTPTVLDAFGLACPPFLEGSSMRAAFTDPTTRIREMIGIEFHRYEVDHDGWGGFQPIRCVHDGRYKLVINLLDSDELYDLETDPQEMQNLIDRETLKEIRDRLHAALLEEMDRTRDPFRGPVWERRPWQSQRTRHWRGPMRVRPEDGYERLVLHYSTGLEPEQPVFEV